YKHNEIFCALLLFVGGGLWGKKYKLISPELMQQIKAHMMQLGGECKSAIACMNKKMGFQDASGKIDVDSTYAWLEKLKGLDAELYDKMKVVVDHCVAEVKDSPDECDTALDIFNCCKKEEKAVGLEQIDWHS
ncbi:hypothetical protein ILUMI_08648, partial [Ignelater luminosus]